MKSAHVNSKWLLCTVYILKINNILINTVSIHGSLKINYYSIWPEQTRQNKKNATLTQWQTEFFHNDWCVQQIEKLLKWKFEMKWHFTNWINANELQWYIFNKRSWIYSDELLTQNTSLNPQCKIKFNHHLINSLNWVCVECLRLLHTRNENRWK